MPSEKRRMMLTLPPELAHALDEAREATGVASSSFVVQLLMQTLPMIQALTRAHREAATDHSEALNTLQKLMASAMHEGTSVQMEMHELSNTLRKARTDAKTND